MNVIVMHPSSGTIKSIIVFVNLCHNFRLSVSIWPFVWLFVCPSVRKPLFVYLLMFVCVSTKVPVSRVAKKTNDFQFSHQGKDKKVGKICEASRPWEKVGLI